MNNKNFEWHDYSKFGSQDNKYIPALTWAQVSKFYSWYSNAATTSESLGSWAILLSRPCLHYITVNTNLFQDTFMYKKSR